MMAEQAVTATWQSCKVVMLHNDKNADHHHICHRIEKKTANKFHRLLSSLAQSATFGLKMVMETEVFLPEPKPQVRFYGAAERVGDRALANILEFTASEHFYLAEIELPQVQFCNSTIDWNVNTHGEVTTEGQIMPAAIFANTLGRKTKRIQLCPSEPWGMSFNFPGPVRWWTSYVEFTSNTVMEITVMKDAPTPVAQIVHNQDEIEEMIAEWLA